MHVHAVCKKRFQQFKKKDKQLKKKRNQVIYRLNMGLDAILKPF